MILTSIYQRFVYLSRQMQSEFAKERDWDQFHQPRNLVLAMVFELINFNNGIDLIRRIYFLFMPEWSLQESFLGLSDTVFRLYVSWKLFIKKAQKVAGETGGYSCTSRIIGGSCCLLSKTLTLFKSKICNFTQPIYDLIKILTPYLRPK